MGRLTKDPEIRYTQSSTAVCNFTLAVNRRFQKQGEERKADFIPVVVWGKQAEFCSKYFEKGRQVAVVGRIETSSWEDNEGKKRYKTEVIADEVYFADSKPQEQSTNTEHDGGFYTPEDNDELPF
jgi:single-strand DNA-binding protein